MTSKSQQTFIPTITYKTYANYASTEGSNAEVGQVIAGIKLANFLTPDMASKNGAKNGTD